MHETCIRFNGTNKKGSFDVMRLSKYTGEHLELGGSDISSGEENQVFRLLFMVSPAIVLFMALIHLSINWTGLLYHIMYHKFQML